MLEGTYIIKTHKTIKIPKYKSNITAMKNTIVFYHYRNILVYNYLLNAYS